MTAPSYRATRTTTVSTAHGTVRHARHHLDLTGARTVRTSQLTAAATALKTTVAEQGMLCLTAPAGAGKTFTLHTILDQHPDWHPIQVLPQPQARPDDLRHSLHHALGLPGQPPKDPGTSDDLIRHALHHPPRLLAIDEAHQLSASCLEYLRYLYDDPHTHLALVLAAGSHRIRALRTTPVLASRVTRWYDLDVLDTTQIPTAIPAFHPLWRTTDPVLLLHLDQAWAHGNFRRWATLTRRSTDRVLTNPEALLRRLSPRQEAP
ncbi:ATP-binding protein [Streptomyces sp. AM2-3-1]|uniref:ATP-binding protein n=1 Tax=Streptomyces sp. AM2-3-1 TaxID=3075824 RepID=UPI0028C46D66|nr:ATP-binding protein [Streptomyces sp. AM2-3-1]WNO62395.1 ATP-binding protein [Streptomyces sp. AM2-3-1]WNO69551.1 ATP-binding protein [Streptomyces sp. AM2-3-1]